MSIKTVNYQNHYYGKQNNLLFFSLLNSNIIRQNSNNNGDSKTIDKEPPNKMIESSSNQFKELSDLFFKDFRIILQF